MNQNSIPDLPYLNNENFENIFDVKTDENGFYYYNLLQTVNLPSNLPKGLLTPYQVVYGDTWPYISYKNYGTPNLWWIILPFNNIINPTQQPIPGTQISILGMNYVKEVISQISTQPIN
jgi:hypothetical protein